MELQGERRRAKRGAYTNPPVGNSQSVTIDFPAVGTLYPATMVEMIIDRDSDLVTGSHGPETLRGFRLAKPGRMPRQPVTVALENDVAGDRVSDPAGTGFARGSANGRGKLPLLVFLGDCQRFATTLCLSQTNQSVVFVQPYPDKTESFFGGIITIGDIGMPGRGGSVESETAGLQWRKIARERDRSYPLGIGLSSPLGVTGNVSKWVPMPSAHGVALSLGLDSRRVLASFLAPPVMALLPEMLSLRNGYSLVRITPSSAVPWVVRANPRLGTLAGRMTLPAPAVNSRVSGVLLQDQSFGFQIGVGLVKIPILGSVPGSFETMGLNLDNANRISGN
ncbi:MAG: hypothetical protein KDN20_05545 [Verrucomicrobiae bacterium]|nr:hypothetical protein [Verrucomicrobiae bacterium]